jgi:serine/threonine-protein kinase
VDEQPFGRYQLLGLIGKGGMGQVYRAHDTVIGRDVAIKVLPPELAGEPGYAERFRREAYTVARLNEPHIIPIYDTGEIDGRLFLAMPIIDGVDLETLLARDGAMRPELVVKVVEQVAAALDKAHAHGLVHRDVKPSNILMTATEFAYLIDFGIARDASEARLTQTGSVIGTWAYMAPERFMTGLADARADVYALACVLHECLTGVRAYPGNSLEQQMAGHLTLQPPRPTETNPGVPPNFDSVIERGLAKDPEHRYQTASELAVAARSALDRTAAAAPPTPNPLPDTVAAPLIRSHDPQPVTQGAPQADEDLRTTVLPKRDTSPPRPATPDTPPARPVKRDSPTVPFAIAAALALLVVGVALLGLGAPAMGGDLPPGTVTVSGIDPVGTGEVPVDLAKPIPITVTVPGADSVSLALNILGRSVGQREAPLAPGPAGGSTTLPPPVNRFVMAGELPAEITVMQGQNPVGTYRFTLSSTQSAVTTATAAGTLALLLIAAAYLESNIRVLRRGKESPASVVAALLFAAALGVAAVAAAWVLLGKPPTVATVATSAALGACAGLAAAIGARRAGSRTRRGQSRR